MEYCSKCRKLVTPVRHVKPVFKDEKLEVIVHTCMNCFCTIRTEYKTKESSQER